MHEPLLKPAGRLALAVPMALAVFVALPSVASAQVCADATKLPGVSSNCRKTVQAGELDASQSTYWFSKNATPVACPNQACMLQKGNALCGAVAKLDGLSGAFACVLAATDCLGNPLSQSNSLVGSVVCPDTQVCCVPRPNAATAGSGSPGGSVALPDPLGGVTLPVLIGNVIRTFAGIAGAIALLMFVYGGIMWIISSGDKGKVDKAQAILKNASIGLVLIFGAYFFVAAIIGGILTNPGS